jgi:hypothetical protein
MDFRLDEDGFTGARVKNLVNKVLTIYRGFAPGCPPHIVLSDQKDSANA